jgi:hypothetical protein
VLPVCRTTCCSRAGTLHNNLFVYMIDIHLRLERDSSLVSFIVFRLFCIFARTLLVISDTDYAKFFLQDAHFRHLRQIIQVRSATSSSLHTSATLVVRVLHSLLSSRWHASISISLHWSHIIIFDLGPFWGLVVLEIGWSSVWQAKTSVLKEWVSKYETTRKANYDRIM